MVPLLGLWQTGEIKTLQKKGYPHLHCVGEKSLEALGPWCCLTLPEAEVEGHWEDGVPDIGSSWAGELFAACAEQHLLVVLIETGAFHVTLETWGAHSWDV